MSTTDIDALVVNLRGLSTSSVLTALSQTFIDAADTLERQQAVVRVLRSMDRRGLLVKELRDALATLDAVPEGEG